MRSPALGRRPCWCDERLQVARRALQPSHASGLTALSVATASQSDVIAHTHSLQSHFEAIRSLQRRAPKTVRRHCAFCEDHSYDPQVATFELNAAHAKQAVADHDVAGDSRLKSV